MNETDKSYWLLSETSGIGETRDPRLDRRLPLLEGFRWLSAGWRDFWMRPGSSLAYGIGVFLLSVAFVWTLTAIGRDYILFPALAGFLIVAPFLAIGLYEKSRAIEEGRQIAFGSMLPRATPRRRTGLLRWSAALPAHAVCGCARPCFSTRSSLASCPSRVSIISSACSSSTASGWMMLAIGSAVGGLFAAFAFAVSVFSVPMLLDQRVDALTAMGSSMMLVWNNLTPMLAWGAMVVLLFAACVATGLIGLIVVFPLLGHATWHAYRAVVPPGGLVR